jgi:polyhydroxyalkanoate synthase
MATRTTAGRQRAAPIPDQPVEPPRKRTTARRKAEVDSRLPEHAPEPDPASLKASAPTPAKSAAPAIPADPPPSPVSAAEAATPATPAGVGEGLGELIATASRNTLAINPLVGLSPGQVFGAATSLLKVMGGGPARTVKHYTGYLKTLGNVVAGKSELAPDPKDRRFADPAWKGNGAYERIMKGYLATQQELNGLIDDSELDEVEKGKAHFFASLLTDALAPSNFILGNPAAVRKVLDTGGANLVKGLGNLVHDIRHNNRMPSQVDATPFKVGENIATSPGHVVLRDEMFELLQFTPTTPQVHARPLVMSPPQVNKYYAVDLTPEKSLIKWAVDSGVQVFVVSWRNPALEHRDWRLEDYAMALDRAVDAAREITGSADVNMWGTCSGGMTLAAYLGWLAARGDSKVASTTWAVCVLDAGAALRDSTLGLFNSPETLRAARERSARKGIVSGAEMAAMFAWLRPNDLIWNYWVNNYLLGNKPPAFDILAWNADTTRLPGSFHADLLDLIEKNPYVHPGQLKIKGEAIDMSRVQLDAYVVGGITDHITPWRACYGTARLFGPESTYVLANAGHLQSLINPPGAGKSFFLAAPATADDPDQWAKAAEGTRVEGSWWPHWRAWIQSRSGDEVDAPLQAGSGKYRPLVAAPGTYVLEK